MNEKLSKKIKNIIRQYPKTDGCELQTLGELNEWQIKELMNLFEELEKENEGLKKSVVSQSSAMLNQQQRIEELENILKDNPSHSDMDAAVFTNNMLQQHIEELEKYIKFLEEFWGIPERLKDGSPTKILRDKLLGDKK